VALVVEPGLRKADPPERDFITKPGGVVPQSVLSTSYSRLFLFGAVSGERENDVAPRWLAFGV